MKLFISLFLCCIIFAFAYELDDLPYEIDALEPYYPGHVIEVHRRHHVGYCKKSTAALVGTALEEPYYPGHVIEVHRRHHVGYCKKSTAALVGTALEGFPIEYVISHLEELPVEKRQILKNVGGGLANHTFFWQCLSPNMGQRPKGKLLNQIELDFGSFESFWGEFSSSLSSLFGSGWTWL
ncbi:superoxide dismutase, partial [Aduncisulcus paluster]